ncbi:hypothetical protein T484DRAFT_2489112 [Baffinella frigidus]|nr:hypothetical protein T484DRAFT_2489112 [Cryptophyta sp. CCMP2293]
MVVLGGWAFLMSQVPLYACSAALRHPCVCRAVPASCTLPLQTLYWRPPEALHVPPITTVVYSPIVGDPLFGRTYPRNSPQISTPNTPGQISSGPLAPRRPVLQGYLAHKKPLPPRTLQKAYA